MAMALKVFRHLWGIDSAHEVVFPRFAEAGYNGIETGLPKDPQKFSQLLSQHGFAYIPQLFTGGGSVAEHVESFRRQVEQARALSPVLINVHSGRDAWSMADAESFYREALAIERESGIPVAHETHRGRVFYNPWTTAALLEKFADLKLCLDYSHWAVVCERLFDDRSILDLCVERTLHVHARVGYEEGPQVPDPSAPEYGRHLEFHEALWDRVWASQRARGISTSTLTPEFGPPMYLHTLPHTNVPVADLWQICDWMAQRQRERFSR